MLADALADALKADPARLAPGSLQAQLEIFGDRCEPLDALRRRVPRGGRIVDGCGRASAARRTRTAVPALHAFGAGEPLAGDAPCGRAAAVRAGALQPADSQQRAALTEYWTAQALGGITAVDIAGGHFDCLNTAFVDTRLKEAQ